MAIETPVKQSEQSLISFASGSRKGQQGGNYTTNSASIARKVLGNPPSRIWSQYRLMSVVDGCSTSKNHSGRVL